MQYESIISDICGRDWRQASNLDYQGGLGVAIVLSYIKGIRPTIDEISKHLDIPVDDLYHPFQRLLYGGIFLKEFNARNDPELLGRGISDTVAKADCVTRQELIRNAWCQIAGIASGIVYRNPSKINSSRKKKKGEKDGAKDYRKKDS